MPSTGKGYPDGHAMPAGKPDKGMPAPTNTKVSQSAATLRN